MMHCQYIKSIKAKSGVTVELSLQSHSWTTCPLWVLMMPSFVLISVVDFGYQSLWLYRRLLMSNTLDVWNQFTFPSTCSAFRWSYICVAMCTRVFFSIKLLSHIFVFGVTNKRQSSIIPTLFLTSFLCVLLILSLQCCYMSRSPWPLLECLYAHLAHAF